MYNLIGLAICFNIAMLSTSAVVPSNEFTHLVDSPKVLHSSIAGQWGGHTFCYTLLGEKRLFWTATAYNENDKTPTALIGQYSLNDPTDSKFTAIRFTEPNVKGSNQPQIIRTPDGYIHVFIGVTYDIGNPNLAPGKLRYYRSKEPEDISILIDRTELIPTEPYGEFHLRMNVGISPDGDRMALVILAVSADGSVPFNTPVIFFGKGWIHGLPASPSTILME